LFHVGAICCNPLCFVNKLVTSLEKIEAAEFIEKKEKLLQKGNAANMPPFLYTYNALLQLKTFSFA